jgi:hypothetical protein
MNASDEFRDAFLGGGSYISQECMCGIVHFCNPENSIGDFEDGEYERLKELQKENPDKYIETDNDCISYFHMGDNVIVWGCPCGNDIYYEKLFWNNRQSIMSYYRSIFEEIERNFWDFSDMIHKLDEMDTNDKLTYMEFLNKLRERKLNYILENK